MRIPTSTKIGMRHNHARRQAYVWCCSETEGGESSLASSLSSPLPATGQRYVGAAAEFNQTGKVSRYRVSQDGLHGELAPSHRIPQSRGPDSMTRRIVRHRCCNKRYRYY
jgi:hypothetical protein